jgi:hypothetical protein
MGITFIDASLYDAYPAFQEELQALRKVRKQDLALIKSRYSGYLAQERQDAYDRECETYDMVYDASVQALIEKHQIPLYQTLEQALQETGCATFCQVHESHPGYTIVQLTVTQLADGSKEVYQIRRDIVPPQGQGRSWEVHYQAYTNSWLPAPRTEPEKS